MLLAERIHVGDHCRPHHHVLLSTKFYGFGYPLILYDGWWIWEPHVYTMYRRLSFSRVKREPSLMHSELPASSRRFLLRAQN